MEMIKRAKLLRKKLTGSESILWECLRNRKCGGYKFRRQHPIDRFILDFFCPDAKLGIELDGEIHNERKENDVIREQYLAQHGISIIRISNEEIENQLEQALHRILVALRK